VTNSDTKTPSEHFDELLLAYAEDSVAPEERQALQEHVDHCPRCSKEVQSLRAIIAALKEHKRAFCPEAWEIYESVQSGEAPHGALSLHLKQCPHCLEEFESYSASTVTEVMPADLLARIKQRLEQLPVDQTTETVEKKRPFISWDRILDYFRHPALGVAAAVAAILVVVLIYPREPMERMVGLSAVAWENVPRPKVDVDSTRKRSAVLILFKDFKEPLSRDQVDSLYQALEPPMEVSGRFDVIPPAVLTKAIKRGEVDPFNRKKLLEDLDDKLNVENVALVTIEPAHRGFDVRCDLIRTVDGTSQKKGIVRGVNEADLASTLRKLVWELTLDSGTK
jgi:hypothetical protein